MPQNNNDDPQGALINPEQAATTVTSMDKISRDLLNVLKAKLYELVLKKETDWTIMSPAEAENLTKKIDEVKQLRTQLADEITAAKNKKRLTLREIEDFQQNLGQIQTKLAEIETSPVTEEEYIVAKEKIQQYAQELQNKEQEKNAIERSLNALQEQIQNSEQSIQAKQTEIHDIRSRLENTDQSVQERQVLTQALQAAQASLENQRARQQDFSQQRNERLAQIQSIDPQIQNLAQRIQDLNESNVPHLEREKHEKRSELEQVRERLKSQTRNPTLNLIQQQQEKIKQTQQSLSNLESFQNNIPSQNIAQIMQLFNEALAELPNIKSGVPFLNGPHNPYENQLIAKKVRDKFIQVKNALAPYSNLGIDFDHLIASANAGIPDNSGLLGPESLEYPKLRLRDVVPHPGQEIPDPRILHLPVAPYHVTSFPSQILPPIASKEQIHEALNKWNNHNNILLNHFNNAFNFPRRIQDLKQKIGEEEKLLSTYNNLVSDEALDDVISRDPSFLQKQGELSNIESTLQQRIIDRENFSNQHAQLLQQKLQLQSQIPDLEKQITENQGSEQQILETIRQNQDRLRRTDWLEQEGIDPQIIRNNIEQAQGELARLTEQKEILSQQLVGARDRISNTEQEINTLRRAQTIERPTLEKIIERHDLPPELKRQKEEGEARIKQLRRELEDIPMDGTPETQKKIEDITSEINNIQASFSLSAPLNSYHEKAGKLIDEYGKIFFPEHEKMAGKLQEIENRPRLENLLQPFLGKLARDPLQDADKFRDRAEEEYVRQGIAQDHIKKYGYDKKLIDSQFNKMGAGNSAARHFAQRQHAAMTDYLTRRDIGRFNLENFQKSFQNALADRNATTNVINNITNAHTSQGNIDTQNLNMRDRFLQRLTGDVRDLASAQTQYGNLLHSQQQGALDRNYQHRLNTNRYADEKVLRAAQVASGVPPTMTQSSQYPMGAGPSNLPPLPSITPVYANQIASTFHDLIPSSQPRTMAHGGYLQRLASGGTVKQQENALPYTDEMIQRANYLENARMDPAAEAYTNMLAAWTASPQTPTMGRIGQALLANQATRRNDFNKHIENVKSSTEIYGTLQKQQQLQKQFLEKHNLDIKQHEENVRHHKAIEGLSAARSSGSENFKLDRADIKTVQDIKKRQEMIASIAPKIQRAKELAQKIKTGGWLTNLTDNPYILSMPGVSIGNQEDIAEFNVLTKTIVDQLGSELGGKNFGSSMMKMVRDSKPTLSDPKATIVSYFDKLEKDINQKAETDQYISSALSDGLHVHEAMALNPDLYKSYQFEESENNNSSEGNNSQNIYSSEELPSVKSSKEDFVIEPLSTKRKNKQKKSLASYITNSTQNVG